MAKKTKKAKKVAKKPAKKSKRKAPKVYVVADEVLAPIVGKGKLLTSQVVSKIWDYIHKHKLQDMKNKRIVIADEQLKKVFGGKAKVEMMQLTKLYWKHLKVCE